LYQITIIDYTKEVIPSASNCLTLIHADKSTILGENYVPLLAESLLGSLFRCFQWFIFL